MLKLASLSPSIATFVAARVAARPAASCSGIRLPDGFACRIGADGVIELVAMATTPTARRFVPDWSQRRSASSSDTANGKLSAATRAACTVVRRASTVAASYSSSGRTNCHLSAWGSSVSWPARLCQRLLSATKAFCPARSPRSRRGVHSGRLAVTA